MMNEQSFTQFSVVSEGGLNRVTLFGLDRQGRLWYRRAQTSCLNYVPKDDKWNDGEITPWRLVEMPKEGQETVNGMMQRGADVQAVLDNFRNDDGGTT